MELYDCCFEGTAKDNSGVGALTEQTIELVFSLIDPSYLEESLEDYVGDLRDFTLLSLFGRSLLLGRRAVNLEIEFAKHIQEGWNSLGVVLHFEKKLVL